MAKEIEVEIYKDNEAEGKVRKFKMLFPDATSCLSLLADCKWKNGFICRKCGNTNYCSGKHTFSRRCTRCKTEESATANTLFHGCKISLEKAFEMAFTVCSITEISSYQLSRQTEIRHMTCYQFQKKVMACKEKSDRDLLLDEILNEITIRLNQ